MGVALWVAYEFEILSRYALICLTTHFSIILMGMDTEVMSMILIWMSLMGSLVEDRYRQPFRMSWKSIFCRWLFLATLILVLIKMGKFLFPYLERSDWRKDPWTQTGLTTWSILHYIDFLVGTAILREVFISVLILCRFLAFSTRYFGTGAIIKFF